MLDLSVFETLERDRFPKLKNLSVPFIATEILLNYELEYKKNQYYDHWSTKVASPLSLNLTECEVEPFLEILKNFEDIENHPANNIRFITFDSNNVKSKIIGRFINKPHFANLKSLKICGENLVDDLETIVNADKSEFTMTNLETLQLNCDHYQSEQPASCILNKNFERLHTLHLSFKKNLIIDFDEELVSKYNMKIKKLSLCNIAFGSKACVHFSSAFKELEVLCLKKCTFEELADHSFLSEFPKLKALSISNMSDELVRSIVDAKHSHFDLTSKLRARLEGICLEKIKDSTSSSKPSGKAKEETKKVSSKMSKGIKGDEESFTKSILSRLQVLKNLKAIRITGMEIKIEINKEDSFKNLKTFEILDCKVSGKTIIQNIQKYFPHLEELSLIELNIEPQKVSKNGLQFPNIEKLSLDHTIIDQTIHALKGGKVTKEIATEKIYRSIIEDNKTLRYLETFVRFQKSNFHSPADEDAFIDGWAAMEMCTKAQHIDEIKLFIPSTLEMSSQNPRIPKTFVTRIKFGYMKKEQAQMFSNYWRERYFE